MSKFNLFQPDSITVTSNIQAGDFIPERVAEVMGREMADRAKETILQRVSKGKFPGNPDGTGPVRTETYSTGSRSFPMTRMGDKSRTRSSRYESMMSRVQATASQSDNGVQSWRSKNGNPWVYVPGGYSRLRSIAGLPSGKVTMSFTGRLLEDLVVKPSIERYGREGELTAASQIVSGKVGGGGADSIGTGFSKSFDLDFELADVIASISLKIGFSTQSSWQIAKWQGQRYGHYFALLTPKEKQELRVEGARLARKAREKYGTDAPTYAPQDSQGFVPINL